MMTQTLASSSYVIRSRKKHVKKTPHSTDYFCYHESELFDVLLVTFYWKMFGDGHKILNYKFIVIAQVVNFQ